MTGDSTAKGGSGPDTARVARLHLWEFQWVRDLLVVVSVISVFWLGYALRYVTVPLLVAFGLAYLMEPLVSMCVRVLKLSRVAAVSVILAATTLAAVGAGALIVPLVANQTSSILKSARDGQFSGMVDKVETLVPSSYSADLRRVREWIARYVLDTGDAAPVETPVPVTPVIQPLPATTALTIAPVEPGESTVESLLGRGAVTALSTLRAIFELLFAALLIPFYFWFFSVSFPSALTSMEQMIPVSRRAEVVRLARDMDQAVAGFVRVRILIAAAMGVMISLGLWLVGVPFAFTLGLFAGILSVVPYLGFLATPLAIMLLATSQLALPEADRVAWWWIPLGPIAVFIVVQCVEGYLLTPYFAAKTTNLGPVSVFVAILAGASLAGVYGMLLAIPVAACVRIALKEVMMPRMREWVEGRRADPLPLE